MKLRDCRLLTDENVHGSVVAYLRSIGFDVLDVREQGLSGSSDTTLLKLATDQTRVVMTYDSDFGNLAIRTGQSTYGILFIRPADMKASEVIDVLDVLVLMEQELSAPFIVTANTSVGKSTCEYDNGAIERPKKTQQAEKLTRWPGQLSAAH